MLSQENIPNDSNEAEVPNVFISFLRKDFNTGFLFYLAISARHTVSQKN
jgi:hypothetical protein